MHRSHIWKKKGFPVQKIDIFALRVLYSNHDANVKEHSISLFWLYTTFYNIMWANTFTYLHIKQCIIKHKNYIILNCLLFRDPLRMKFWDVTA